MQIARMMEPKPRTWQNKLIEMFRALQLEHRFTKEELLTIYFNIAPYGGNIEGVAAAAWLYFGKEPDPVEPRGGGSPYRAAQLTDAVPPGSCP